MNEVPMYNMGSGYPVSSQGVIRDPPQVLGSYSCPTVGAFWLPATWGLQGCLAMKDTRPHQHNGSDENMCLAEMWSGSEEGSYLRLID